MNELPCRVVNLTRRPPGKNSVTPTWKVVTDKGTYETRDDSSVNYLIHNNLTGREVVFLMDGKTIAGLI